MGFTQRLHPFRYLDEVMRVLPYWPDERYLELAPKHWPATRARLSPDELSVPLCSIQAPPPPALDQPVLAAPAP